MGGQTNLLTVFQVAGTIITYELVLIQFDQDEETGTEELCSPIYN